MSSLKIGRLPSLGYACAEGFNTLCTNLSFSGENVKKIMVTSCHASEGKSFVSMNVMRMMAKLGKRVVLVDADLRRSGITAQYKVQFEGGKKAPGLAHLLSGFADEESVIYRTNVVNALMVPVGREVSNPLQLLNSKRFGALLDHLAEKMDYVIVDVPPVGTVIDGAEIAKSCDGTLLVVSYNEVRRQELIDVRDQLEQTGCPILGTVLNQVEFDNYLNRYYYYKSYHSYGYDKYYGKTKDDASEGDRRKKSAGAGKK